MEKHLSLEEISTQIGYSPSHFSMLFKKQTGHSPLTYFNLLKMQQACLLLDTTDMKINQICYKIGIEDTYYFPACSVRSWECHHENIVNRKRVAAIGAYS